MVSIVQHGNLPTNFLSIKLSKLPPLQEIKPIVHMRALIIAALLPTWIAELPTFMLRKRRSTSCSVTLYLLLLLPQVQYPIVHLYSVPSLAFPSILTPSLHDRELKSEIVPLFTAN